MAAEHEAEELQLQLESKVCGLGVDALAQLCISQLKPRPLDPRDKEGNLTFTHC